MESGQYLDCQDFNLCQSVSTPLVRWVFCHIDSRFSVNILSQNQCESPDSISILRKAWEHKKFVIKYKNQLENKFEFLWEINKINSRLKNCRKNERNEIAARFCFHILCFREGNFYSVQIQEANNTGFLTLGSKKIDFSAIFDFFLILQIINYFFQLK